MRTRSLASILAPRPAQHAADTRSGAAAAEPASLATPADRKSPAPALGAPPAATPAGDSLQALNEALEQAGENQLLRVVATIDSLGERGAADEIIAPLRVRLRALNPPRRLGFCRLLLLPLEPLIVPPHRWRAGEPTLPRYGLVRLAHHVREVMGNAAIPIEQAIVGHTTGEIDLVARIGRVVWPAAARVLQEAYAGDRPWLQELGSSGRLVAHPAAILLAEAATLQAVVTETAEGLLPPPTDALRAIANRIMLADQSTLPMFMTLLLTHMPQAVTQVQDLLPARHALLLRKATDHAVRLLLHRLGDGAGMDMHIGIGTLRQAGGAAQRIMLFLEYVATQNHREPARTARRHLQAACAARFERDLQAKLLTPLQDAMQPLETDAIAALEATARGLRALEAASRSVGSVAAYAPLIRQAMETIGSARGRQALSPVDQIRLLEILGGPEAAAPLLPR